MWRRSRAHAQRWRGARAHHVVAQRAQPAVVLALCHDLPKVAIAAGGGGQQGAPRVALHTARAHITRPWRCRNQPHLAMQHENWWRPSGVSMRSTSSGTRSPSAMCTAAVNADRVPLSVHATASVLPAGMWPTLHATAWRGGARRLAATHVPPTRAPPTPPLPRPHQPRRAHTQPQPR